MVDRRHIFALRVYGTAISAVGMSMWVVAVRHGGPAEIANASAPFWVLGAFLVGSRVVPIQLPAQRGAVRMVISDVFAFALLASWSVHAAVLISAAASLAADGLHRRPFKVVVFNATQYSLALAVAGIAYTSVTGGQRFTVALVPALAGAAVVFVVLNAGLVAVAVSLSRGTRLWLELGSILNAQALASVLSLGLAPVVILLGQRGAAPLLLMALPTVAVHLAVRAIVLADHARQEGERLKDELLATVSHELRSPLTGLLGAIITIRRRGAALTQAQLDELLAMAQRQGERLQRVIEQLLLAAHLERTAGRACERPLVDAGKLVREAAHRAQFANPSRMIHVHVDDVLVVRATPESVLQVIDKLVENAVTHAPAGTPIWLSAARAGSVAVIAVEDAGPGVSVRDRERIFQRFTQLDSGATRRAGGLGLGLSIARQLARTEGGELVVGPSSHGGPGARFEFRLLLLTGVAEEAMKLLDEH